MSQAIVTKYLGYTNHRSSRIKASARRAGSVVVPYDHTLSPANNHIGACVVLTRKLKWDGNWAMGDLSASEYVFVRCTQP